MTRAFRCTRISGIVASHETKLSADLGIHSSVLDQQSAPVEGSRPAGLGDQAISIGQKRISRLRAPRCCLVCPA